MHTQIESQNPNVDIDLKPTLMVLCFFATKKRLYKNIPLTTRSTKTLYNHPTLSWMIRY